jgi:hypothetical protein
VCKAARCKQVLRLPLKKHAFDMMISMLKHREYKPLQRQNGEPIPWIQSRLFMKSETGTGWDWNAVREYKYVQFYLGQACSESKYAWFVRQFRGVRVIKQVHARFPNGLVVRHDNEPVASIKLGRMICKSEYEIY